MSAVAREAVPAAPPAVTEQVLAQMVTGAWVTQAVAVAAELGLADRMVHGPRTPEELAVETGLHGDSVHRLLRALASAEVFREDDEGRFSLTPLGTLLRSDVPGSRRSLAIMAGEEFYRCWGSLRSSLKTGEPAFHAVFGVPFFEYMEANPERWRLYDAAMGGAHESETVPVLDAYDFAPFRVIVDVGGGSGLALASTLRRHPHTRGILFDLPSVAERARDTLSRSDVADRCEVFGGDLFVSVPLGADAYLLRHVLHDWDDEQAVAILRACREAMHRDGRVLVVETVIPPGNGRCFAKWLDLMMLVVGGRERTGEQYERLLAAAGLRMTRIVPTAHEVSVIEASR